MPFGHFIVKIGRNTLLLTYEEMSNLADRYTAPIAPGCANWTDRSKLFQELYYEWDFDELACKRVIWDMEDKGLI